MKISPTENYCLIVPKIFVKKHFVVSLISVIEKIYDKGGYVRICCRNFFSQYRKISQVFKTFSVSEKFMDKRWGESIKFFPSETFCLIVPIFFVLQFGNPSMFFNFGFRIN